MAPTAPKKSWLATVNNYTDDDITLFRSWGNDVTRITACAETAPSTGTKHLHVKITFKKAKRLTALKKLHGKARWDDMKFDSDDALYCKKDESLQLFDIDNRKQGKRSDLDTAIESIKAGATTKELWQNHTSVMVRYHKGMELAKQHLFPVVYYPKHRLDEYPNWEPITDWSTSHLIIGPANIGKTEFAKAHFPDGFLFVRHIETLLKFDPEIHTGIVFDDMAFRHMPRESQIHLLDVDNPSDIHVRYQTVHIPANTKKIFTCNPQSYPFLTPDDAVDRRVTVTEVTER